MLPLLPVSRLLPPLPMASKLPVPSSTTFSTLTKTERSKLPPSILTVSIPALACSMMLSRASAM